MRSDRVRAATQHALHDPRRTSDGSDLQRCVTVWVFRLRRPTGLTGATLNKRMTWPDARTAAGQTVDLAPTGAWDVSASAVTELAQHIGLASA